MSDPSDVVNLEAEPLRETERALLVCITDWGSEAWVPKSAITDDSEVYSMKSGPGMLQVQGWWARANGLG